MILSQQYQGQGSLPHPYIAGYCPARLVELLLSSHIIVNEPHVSSDSKYAYAADLGCARCRRVIEVAHMGAKMWGCLNLLDMSSAAVAPTCYRAPVLREETKGPFRKRAALANVPSFRVLVPVNIRIYPHSVFWYRGTCAKTTLLETTLFIQNLRTPRLFFHPSHPASFSCLWHVDIVACGVCRCPQMRLTPAPVACSEVSSSSLSQPLN